MCGMTLEEADGLLAREVRIWVARASRSKGVYLEGILPREDVLDELEDEEYERDDMVSDYSRMWKLRADVGRMLGANL